MNITEEMKNNSQLEWVGKMNSIMSTAEEVIKTELIYA